MLIIYSIEEKNELVRKGIAARLGQVYDQITRELTAMSGPLKTVHLSTQVRLRFSR